MYKKISVFFIMLICLSANATELVCGDLELKFTENPNRPGEEFKVKGCYNPKSFLIVSESCKKDPGACLKAGESKKVDHPGVQMGSPQFVLCFKNGGRPRFLEIKVNEKYIDTSTCFFGNKETFMDIETMMNYLEKKAQ